MTCEDCIHYDNIIQNRFWGMKLHSCKLDKWARSSDKPCKYFHKCDKHTADGFQEYVGKDSDVCEDLSK